MLTMVCENQLKTENTTSARWRCLPLGWRHWFMTVPSDMLIKQAWKTAMLNKSNSYPHQGRLPLLPLELTKERCGTQQSRVWIDKLPEFNILAKLLLSYGALYLAQPCLILDSPAYLFWFQHLQAAPIWPFASGSDPNNTKGGALRWQAAPSSTNFLGPPDIPLAVSLSVEFASWYVAQPLLHQLWTVLGPTFDLWFGPAA